MALPEGTFRRIPDPTIPKNTVPVESNDPLFEDKPAAPERPPDTRPSTVAPSLFSKTLPAIHAPAVLWPVLGLLVGLGVLWFGIFNAGGFYEQGSRLSGSLAVFFYVWQVGNILEIIGVVIAWENLKKIRTMLHLTRS
jgi:hypothetical protein